MLNMEQIDYIDDKTGKRVIRFIPVLYPDCTATGTLRFACWEVWGDASCQEITEACAKAMANARDVLRRFADE